jgi:hypothetical protein
LWFFVYCYFVFVIYLFMRKYIILFIAFIFSQVAAHAQHYWQQQVNYVIEVSLDDTARTLDGFVRMEYTNNSPDTLHFIWFHLWPNAYKNDKTAFSDQLLENGRKDFYFSEKDKRGYINRLAFRVDDAPAQMEDHPQHIDIVRLVLPSPLAPGKKTIITTPFHVQLPHIFSRSGYMDNIFQLTQWYPKPAVYDHKGWHPMPYLDQGEFYSEFGNYDVRINVPAGYVVAASGQRSDGGAAGNPLRHTLENAHDFAWFASKEFIVKSDTIQLASGRTINAFSYYTAKEEKLWSNSMQMIKDAIRFRSRMLGEYPYNTVSVVQGPADAAGGMEYPTITVISGLSDEKTLDFIIEHELGHNWFYGILASNERTYPWMDEGMNTYYDLLYMQEKYGTQGMGIMESAGAGGMKSKFPQDELQFALDVVTGIKKDQPINTASDKLANYNYDVIAYLKAARWLQQVEAYVGKEQFNAAMKQYYEQWKFRHPYPEDFRRSVETATGKSLATFYAALDTTETRKTVFEKNRKLKVTGLFSLKDYKKYHYISLMPAIGANKYDKLMIGIGIHNHSLPPNPFQFALFPLYATNSKQLNGIGKISYSWLPDKTIYKVQAGIIGGRFSTRSGLDSNGNKVFGGFYKAVPFVRIIFNEKNPRSKHTWWLDARTYFIGEKDFTFKMKTTDSNLYPVENNYTTRYLNQLTIGADNYRVLYPYDAQLQLQQGKEFYRLNFTGNYFFNYANGGGMNVRLFAAKFGYLGERSPTKELNSFPFQPKLTAVRGDEDYTYSNYFMGRTGSEGLASQQIMMRDGGLKIRTDLFQGLQGRSDEWVASINFSTTLPDKLFPFKLPLKLFLDAGTYAEAWDKNAETSRFLYVGGLQLSLFSNLVNIYAPVVFSKEFKDNLKTIPEDYKFLKRLSFSIDLHTLSSRKLLSRAGVY